MTPARALAALMAAGALATACASTVRSNDPADRPAHPVGIVHQRWRTTLHEHGYFEAEPEECATGVMARGRLVIGSRAGNVVAIDPAQGHVDWAVAVSGGVDSEARYDAARDQIYVGTDDGTFTALDPAQGAIKWSYRGKGAVERAAAFDARELVYFSTASDQVYAVEASTGKWRWQYGRETPEGFTIHGNAGPRLLGDRVLTGFADGYLVSLSAVTGDLQWARSLAAASDQFVDVDSTPAPAANGAIVLASSYSGGLYAVDPRDGVVRWRLGIEGVGTVTPSDGKLYFAAPRQGLHAIDESGRVLWRQGLTAAGDLTPPVVLGHYLVFTGSRAGLFVVDRDTGALFETFNPGRGICGAPTIDLENGRIYVLSNGGALYALDLG
ncbi:MAG TPA: PQQ-binding-like beta-propeller repeat protein [Polyangia bacterium]|nr:PQQ-binding-like beta-propeller repeat protein [Polyangia bacterium]